MGYTVAFAGKGGVGKTTLAAMLVRYLVENGAESVLAVDADPNNNLHIPLQVEVKRTIGDMREEFASNTLSVSGMSKERMLEYKLQELLVEADGFDLLPMGRPEGPGCYCYVNHILRNYIDILQGNYSFVVLDTEAGLEHLSRRTAKDVDLLIIVSQPTLASVLAVERIAELARSLPITVKAMTVVMNMVTSSPPEELLGRIKAISLEVAATLPYDTDLSGFGMTGGKSVDICPQILPLFGRILKKEPW